MHCQRSPFEQAAGVGQPAAGTAQVLGIEAHVLH
jgi:hypothetical protein